MRSKRIVLSVLFFGLCQVFNAHAQMADGYAYREKEDFLPGLYRATADVKVYFDLYKESINNGVIIKRGTLVSVDSAGYHGGEEVSTQWFQLSQDCNDNLLPWDKLGWVGVLEKDFVRVANLPQPRRTKDYKVNCMQLSKDRTHVVKEEGSNSSQDPREKLKNEILERREAGKPQFEIGLKFEKGEGTKVDIKKAIEFYRKSANQGYTPAISKLASMYMHGKGVSRHLLVAHALYRSSYMLGDLTSQPEQRELTKRFGLLGDKFFFKESERLSAMLRQGVFFEQNKNARFANPTYSFTDALDDYIRRNPWAD